MTNWNIQNGRITVFFTAVPKETAAQLYRDIWKSEPDAFSKQGNGPFAASIANGMLGQFAVSCALNPLRADFIISPPMPEDPLAEMDAFPFITDGAALLAAMRELIAVLRQNTLGVTSNRVACSIHFMSVAETFVAANEVIATVLPNEYRIELGGGEDFILQMNHVEASAAAEKSRLNLLTKWSVERLQKVTISVSPTPNGATSIAPRGNEQIVKEILAPSVLFDFNNIPGADLSDHAPADILDELLNKIVIRQRAIGINMAGF